MNDKCKYVYVVKGPLDFQMISQLSPSVAVAQMTGRFYSAALPKCLVADLDYETECEQTRYITITYGPQTMTAAVVASIKMIITFKSRFQLK